MSDGPEASHRSVGSAGGGAWARWRSPAAPPSVDVTGHWSGTWSFQNASVGGGQVIMDLKQSGLRRHWQRHRERATSSQPTYFESTVSVNSVILESAYLLRDAHRQRRPDGRHRQR